MVILAVGIAIVFVYWHYYKCFPNILPVIFHKNLYGWCYVVPIFQMRKLRLNGPRLQSKQVAELRIKNPTANHYTTVNFCTFVPSSNTIDGLILG